MDIRPLGIEGAWVVTPRQFGDDRGVFLESFRGDLLVEQVGHRPDIVQTNVSVSSRGTVRGIHFADVPPGQAKYVTTVGGSFVDDLRGKVGGRSVGAYAVNYPATYDFLTTAAGAADGVGEAGRSLPRTWLAMKPPAPAMIATLAIAATSQLRLRRGW